MNSFRKILTISPLVFIVIINFANGQILTQKYPKGKIVLNSGIRVEGKNLVITQETASLTVGSTSQSFQLKDIKQIQAKKGNGQKYGNTCGGSCLGLALGSYLATGGETEDVYGNKQKIDFGQYLLGTTIWVGLFYGAGYFIGSLTDEWEIVYEDTESTTSTNIEPVMKSEVPAEEKKIGIRVGFNSASFSGDDTYTDYQVAKMGASLGGFITYPINNRFALQPEINLSIKGNRYEDEGFWSEVQMYWLEVPVLGVYTFNRFSVYAGPYLGIYLSGDASYGGDYGSGSDDIKSDDVGNPDFGFIIGGGFSFTRKLSIDGRYNAGLLSLDPDRESDFTNSVVQILVGYSL